MHIKYILERRGEIWTINGFININIKTEEDLNIVDGLLRNAGIYLKRTNCPIRGGQLQLSTREDRFNLEQILTALKDII